MRIRDYIFLLGGVFISGVIFYYAFNSGSIYEKFLFSFYGLVFLLLTFNEGLDLRIAK